MGWLSGIRLYILAAIVAVFGLAAAGVGIKIWSLEHQLHNAQQTAQVATAANGRLNDQVQLGNANLKTMKGVLHDTTDKYRQLQAAEKAQARKSEDLAQQLQTLTAGHPDAARAAAITQQLRADLERIQGHPFDGAAAATYAAPPGNAAYCFSAGITVNMATDIHRLANQLDLIYPPKRPPGSGH